MKQQTLAKEVSFTGVGLHSGRPVTMTLCPAAEDTGIQFERTDIPGSKLLAARAELVTSTMRATTLGDPNGLGVFTIEHLMGAFQGLSVDNCLVRMNSPEPPVMDGSGLGFANMILEAGRVQQKSERKIYELQRAFSVYDGEKYMLALPYNGFRISFTSINPHPLLGTQYFDFELTEENFMKEVAPARTVAFEWEIEQLKKMGLGLGGTLENVVVFGRDNILSQVRYQDELIRHKVLDTLGDLYLLGALRCHVVEVMGGHALNSKLAKQIYAYRAAETKLPGAEQ